MYRSIHGSGLIRSVNFSIVFLKMFSALLQNISADEKIRSREMEPDIQGVFDAVHWSSAKNATINEKKCHCRLSLAVNHAEKRGWGAVGVSGAGLLHKTKKKKVERKVLSPKVQGDNSLNLRRIHRHLQGWCVSAHLCSSVLRLYPSPLTTCKNRPAPRGHMTTQLPQQSQDMSLDTASAGSDLCSGGLFGLLHLN